MFVLESPQWLNTDWKPKHIRVPFPNGRKFRFISFSFSWSVVSHRCGLNVSGSS